jgi:aspartate/methionine/tyrosine aminotransferase
MGRRVASRADITPFYVMEVLRAARERAEAGGEVLHLEVGQPSSGAPRGALAAARAALERPETLGYTDADGLPALRSRIARHYEERHGVEVDASQVAVTVGASVGCVLAFLAAFEPGDRVAVCEPGYPCYRQILVALGLEPVAIPIGADTRYQPTAPLLDAAGPLDGLVIASPSNPTGSVLRADELDAIAAWCDARDVRLVADEIYHGITFDRPAPTALAHDVGAIVVNSFSKYFSMTGWRLGWLVLPTELVRPVELLAQNLVISAPTLSQLAAVAAFDDVDELDAHVARYAANRNIVVDGLRAMGCVDVAPAEGAFYAYADVSHLTDDSENLCRRWLDELGVAVTPGVDFDPARGHHTVRLSYAGATDDVTEAMRRLVAAASAR